jgi:hypothetical protein
MVLLLRIFYSVGSPIFADKPVVFIWEKKCKNYFYFIASGFTYGKLHHSAAVKPKEKFIIANHVFPSF